MTPKTIIALFLIFIAKLAGLMGIALGFSTKYRSWGGTLLFLDGILLFLIVLLCFWEMKAQNKQDDYNKNIIADMLKDGSLQIQLQNYGFKLTNSSNK